jgi:hypothetical protein
MTGRWGGIDREGIEPATAQAITTLPRDDPLLRAIDRLHPVSHRPVAVTSMDPRLRAQTQGVVFAD